MDDHPQKKKFREIAELAEDDLISEEKAALSSSEEAINSAVETDHELLNLVQETSEGEVSKDLSLSYFKKCKQNLFREILRYYCLYSNRFKKSKRHLI